MRKSTLLASFGTCLTAAVAAVGADLWIQAHPSARLSVEDWARQLGNAYDPRTRSELVRHLAALEGEAYTGPAGRHILAPDGNGTLRSPLRIDGREVLPIAGIADVPTVFCNESGQWVWYRADEQGFRNPPGLWNPPVEIMALGDSFVHGFCVADHEVMIDHLRTVVPRTVNLGIAGAGQLTQLALLREFGPILRPRTVLWFFYSNDVTDIETEKLSPMLMRYLEGRGPIQQLHRDKTEIDLALREIYRKRAQERADRRGPHASTGRDLSIRDALLLRTVRHRLGLSFSITHYDFDTFERILHLAKREAAGWGGEIVFVYLPEITLWADDPLAKRYVEEIRNEISRIADAAGLRRIDLLPAFAAHQDPASLFDRPNDHYNAAGHRLIGEALVEALGYR